MKHVVSVLRCDDYDLEMLRRAVKACLEPLGGMQRFVRPGMRVLLKPNLLTAAEAAQAITTHPAVVQAVTELVIAAGGEALIGDSPAGPVSITQGVLRKSGMVDVAEKTGARVLEFDGVTWKTHRDSDYFIARPVWEADLIINLPKLKTHAMALYTGAVKNVFGVIPGTRKREVHVRAPGLGDFSVELANLLEIVHPGLTIMDGILGQEGNGPGAAGTPRHYDCLAASSDAVALDSLMSHAMGYRSGPVPYLALCAQRGLGACDLGQIQVVGDAKTLNFGPVRLPLPGIDVHMPAWLRRSLEGWIQLQPRVSAERCKGCGKCVQACPGGAITQGKPVRIDLEGCIGCMCCAEVCPEAAVTTHRSGLAKMIGI